MHEIDSQNKLLQLKLTQALLFLDLCFCCYLLLLYVYINICVVDTFISALKKTKWTVIFIKENRLKAENTTIEHTHKSNLYNFTNAPCFTALSGVSQV